jgi:hypothetical protein
MRRIDSFLFWMARLAAACPRWVRTWGPLLGALAVPLTLCLFFVVFPVALQRNGAPVDNPTFSAIWLVVSVAAVILAIFGSLFAIVLALSDPPADLGKKR